MDEICIYLRYAENGRGFSVNIYEIGGFWLHGFTIAPHEVPAVALTMMELQIQEQGE